MLTRRLIVCLDVKGGRVVKGTQFVNLRDVGDPVELAARYEAEGADEICFLDISASAEERGTLLDLARRTAERLFVPLTIGGGVRTADDVGRVLRAGADKVSLNTSAVQTPEVIEQAAYRFGAQCVVVSIDAKRRSAFSGPERDGSPAGGPPPDFIIPREGAATATNAFPAASDPSATRSSWEVYTHGGRTPTGLDAVAWARECVRRGAGEILLTSIDRDGARTGYDLELTRAVAGAVDVPVIASGGAGEAAHVRDAIVDAGADAALVAGILHDGLTTVGEIKRAMAAAGLPVRGVEAAGAVA
jgi:cyclase